MKRLDSGDYLVPALRASEAIEVVRNVVPQEQASVIQAVKLGLTNNEQEQLWMVQPYYNGAHSNEADSELVNAEWISSATPTGWAVTIDPKLGLLIIRSTNRSLCYVQPFFTDYIVRGFVRRAFSQLGVTI